MIGILEPKSQHKFRVLFLDADGINNVILTRSVVSFRAELVSKTLTLAVRDDLFGSALDELPKCLSCALVLENLDGDDVIERRRFDGLGLIEHTFTYGYESTSAVDHIITLSFSTHERSRVKDETDDVGC